MEARGSERGGLEEGGKDAADRKATPRGGASVKIRMGRCQKCIASFDQRIYFFLSYTERKERTRIISARLAEPLERKRYDENYQKQISGNE
jgi:hypothetical protein